MPQVVEQHVGEPFFVDRQPFGEHRAGECVVPQRADGGIVDCMDWTLTDSSPDGGNNASGCRVYAFTLLDQHPGATCVSPKLGLKCR